MISKEYPFSLACKYRKSLHVLNLFSIAAIFQEMIEAGVFAVPGCALKCKQPGWFRIVFSVAPDELPIGKDELIFSIRAHKSKFFKLNDMTF